MRKRDQTWRLGTPDLAKPSRRCARRKLLPVPSTPQRATSRCCNGGASGSASMASTLRSQDVHALASTVRSRRWRSARIKACGSSSAVLATRPPIARTHSETPGASSAITGRPLRPASMTTSGTSETGALNGKRNASTLASSRAISAASSISVRAVIRAAAGLAAISARKRCIAASGTSGRSSIKSRASSPRATAASKAASARWAPRSARGGPR